MELLLIPCKRSLFSFHNVLIWRQLCTWEGINPVVSSIFPSFFHWHVSNWCRGTCKQRWGEGRRGMPAGVSRWKMFMVLPPKLMATQFFWHARGGKGSVNPCTDPNYMFFVKADNPVSWYQWYKEILVSLIQSHIFQEHKILYWFRTWVYLTLILNLGDHSMISAHVLFWFGDNKDWRQKFLHGK